jgi:hypothetical protein
MNLYWYKDSRGQWYKKHPSGTVVKVKDPLQIDRLNLALERKSKNLPEPKDAQERHEQSIMTLAILFEYLGNKESQK